MNLSKYEKMFGKGYCSLLRKFANQDHILMAGMLEFDSESAHLWQDPFQGNYAYYEIEDGHKFPGNLRHFDSNDRLAKGTCSIEYPCRIVVSGNTDTQYALAVTSFQAAKDILLYLLESQPLQFDEDFLAAGFIQI